ncbi:MAG: glycoside hydrolase [Gammaproteobacteria bacterium]|nr:glycoside hydrolase [Gammaproteobacteria bacterium]
MHQPHYHDNTSGIYQLPWTYLHAIKDYIDMAAIIESVPGARAVFNFAPTLIEQLDDYGKCIKAYLRSNQQLPDPLLQALVNEKHPVSNRARLKLITDALKANRARLIDRFPAYRKLADIAVLAEHDPLMTPYLSDTFITDLLVWYHLAWIGETVRLESPLVAELMEKGHGFSLTERRQLLALIGELINGIVPRYRKLAEAGAIELSVTPYAHPIVPLLLDFSTTLEAMPHAEMPLHGNYPGGLERSHWHFREGLKVFEQHFGFTPSGCWPSEGSVSDATVKMAEEYGFRWIASGETVLRNSMHHSQLPGDTPLHQRFRLCGTTISQFFRDDGFSDAIGFRYSNWDSHDAVGELIHNLHNIDALPGDRVVPIILDGENAWEYYPENGYHFLTQLYQRLVADPRLELTTFSDCLDSEMTQELTHLVPGSWVYGTFSTWIGSKDKNRGWDLLCEAKNRFDSLVKSRVITSEKRYAIEKQLAICEGSDWFWWFGDYNPSGSVADFDRLYRLHLHKLYEMMGIAPPEELNVTISMGNRHATGDEPATGGVMRQGKAS